MLEIKHTLCPSCSVGCGINVVLKDGEVVGTFPYKRHPVNAGKNCLNGRNSIDSYLNKFENADGDALIGDIKKELQSADSSNVTVICSGNNTIEEIEAIKEFAQSNGYNIGFYADDLKHAKQNGAKISAFVNAESSVTSNITDECFSESVGEFLDACKGDIDESSVVVFNQIEAADDLAKIEALNCKILPVFSKSNTKGALGILDAKSKDEMFELLDSTKVYQIRNGAKDAILMQYDVPRKEWTELLRTPYHLNSFVKHDSLLYVPCEYGYWTVHESSYETTHFEALSIMSGQPLETDINVIAFDRQGGMWAGTESRGILYSMPYKQPFHAYPWGTPIANQLGSMMSNVNQWPKFRDRTVNCVFKDSRGWTWVGTSQGLQVYRRESDLLPQVYTTKDGLYNNIGR